MFKEHSSINTPPSNQEIWRYMDLWKFLDIIDNSRLFLSQARHFEDKLEGRFPVSKRIPPDHDLKQIDSFAERFLKYTHYINCWSLEKYETYPLWKIYSDYRTAVAIKSTIGDLIASISEDEKDQYIGKISYVDPNGKYYFDGNIFQFFYEKRNYFGFEKEVRLITILDQDQKEILDLPPGISIKIKPEVLIKEIKLAPLADQSFKKLIELKLSSCNLNIPVTFSDI